MNELSNSSVCLTGFFQLVNDSNKFFCCMGNRNGVMLALSSLFTKIYRECRIPVTYEFCRIEQCISQVS